MDCRETQALLTAFHDGEAPAAERARLEAHLRGCPECRALLAGLARADRAAGVPDPGPAYWERFNARVMDRIGREADGHGWSGAEAGRDAAGSSAPADGPETAVPRPRHGRVRRQLRYLVPAAAAAALVVGIVRYGGMDPPVAPTAMDGQAPGQAGMPADPQSRPAAVGPAFPDPAGRRRAGAEPGARAAKTAESAPAARRVPSPSAAEERIAAVPREERHRAAAPSGIVAPSTPPPPAPRSAPDGSPPAAAADGMRPGMRDERKKAEGAAALTAERQLSGKAEPSYGTRTAKEASPVPPCARARSLAEAERIREAEEAQRACLAGDLPAPSREKGLVFLAELLDRQARFAEADAVIAEVDRRFPQSPPLELYRRQRPMVQKQPMTVPVTR